MRARLILPMVVAVASLWPSAAAHAAGWVSSAPLSPADRVATEPGVLVTPGGERVIAWVQNLQNGFTAENISVRVAPAGGDFGPTQTFAGGVDGPRLAVAADGTVALAWTEFGTRTVHIARMLPGQSSFVEATPLTVPSAEAPFDVKLAFDGDDALAAFQSSAQSANSTSIWLAHLAPGSGAVSLATGAPLDHHATPQGQPQVFLDEPSIAVDGGRVFVSWQQQNEGVLNSNGVVVTDASTSVKYAMRPAGGQFGAPVTVDSTVDHSEFSPDMTPHLAGGGGHVYIVWVRPRDQQDVNFEDLGAGGPQLRIPTDPFLGDLHVGADRSGTLIVAGDAQPPGSDNRAVSAAVVPAGTAPAAAVRLTSPGISRQADDLAVAADGTALVLPDRFPDSFSRAVQVFASVRPAGGGFGATQDVSSLQDGSADPFDFASAAVAPGGRALVLWSAGDNSGAPNGRLRLSEFDATPPVFGAVSVPARATAGQRAGFSATATDALAPSTTISWDFGDGSQADGASVTHVFGAPGAATVTVTATDSAGNTVSQTRIVPVAPARAGVDRTTPVISRLSLAHARFRVGSRGTAAIASTRRRHPSAPTGTTLRMTLSERATVAIQIRRRTRGRGVLRGTLVRAGAGPGALSISFSGRIGRAALGSGPCVATVTAIDGAGNRSVPRTIGFTVVAR
jgi:PKD domain